MTPNPKIATKSVLWPIFVATMTAFPLLGAQDCPGIDDDGIGGGFEGIGEVISPFLIDRVCFTYFRERSIDVGEFNPALVAFVRIRNMENDSFQLFPEVDEDAPYRLAVRQGFPIGPNEEVTVRLQVVRDLVVGDPGVLRPAEEALISFEWRLVQDVIGGQPLIPERGIERIGGTGQLRNASRLANAMNASIDIFDRDAKSFYNQFVGLKSGKREFQFDLDLGSKVPQDAIEAIGRVRDVRFRAADAIARAFEDAFKGGPVPCGVFGPHGLVVCPETLEEIDSGDWAMLTQTVNGPIPLNDRENLFQYGFLFETDGSPANDWNAPPGLQGDFFQDTDRWYTIENSSRAGDWVLHVTDVVNPAAFTTRASSSSAIALIDGDTVILLVPLRELGEDPKFRLTSFRHTGDFGQDGDWSADHEPNIDDPLEALFPEGPPD